MTNTYTDHALNPLTASLTMVCKADEWGDSAFQSRLLDDHSSAGRYREQERACLKRAEILALVAQASALESIADSLSRWALAQ